jgi:hypothetical protein
MLVILLTSAGVYQEVRNTGERHYSENTCINYLTMKVRHFDDADGEIYVGEIDGQEALFLSETIDGDVYVTAVYYYDGYVREFFSNEGYAFEPGDGSEIIAARDLDFYYQPMGLLFISCTGVGGTVADVYLSLRNWRAVG